MKKLIALTVFALAGVAVFAALSKKRDGEAEDVLENDDFGDDIYWNNPTDEDSENRTDKDIEKAERVKEALASEPETETEVKDEEK